MEESVKENQEIKKPIVVLTGPTAVGKTELSLKLASAINGEIISADSMQVYKYMDVGTAKIKQEEMCEIKHYLVDELEPDEDFNVVRFKEKTIMCLEEIYAKGKIPILVGGTGFYIQAILYDIDFSKTIIDNGYRKELEDLAKDRGNEYLHEMLKEVDEESSKVIHCNNVKRVIRALEYYKDTNTPISKHNEKQRENQSPYNFAYIVLNTDREKLYENIDKRVDVMIKKGLVEEVNWLYRDKQYSKDLISMQGLGYKEIIDYLDGLCTLEQAIYILKRDTRHFAKRQLTWFKREKEVSWINKKEYYDNEELILKEILDILNNKQIFETSKL